MTITNEVTDILHGDPEIDRSNRSIAFVDTKETT